MSYSPHFQIQQWTLILTGKAVVFVLAVGFNLVLLVMSIIVKRMTWRAVRWQVLNVSVWNIVSTVFYASYGEQTPWKGYIQNHDVAKYYMYIKPFCFTTFHNGMIFVFIESIIVFIIPSLENNFIFSMIWLILICAFANACLLFAFFARIIWGDVEVNGWWYDPIGFYQVVILGLFSILIPVYLITAIVASIVSCTCKMKHRARHHLDLWGTLIYGIVTFVPFALSALFPTMSFLGDKLPNLVAWIFDMLFPMPATPGTPVPGEPTTTAVTTTTQEPFDIVALLDLVAKIFNWTDAAIPLVEAVCTILFITSYSQQFLFLISCGHFFDGKRTFKDQTEQQDRLFYPTAVHSQKQLISAPGHITQKVPAPSIVSATAISIHERPTEEFIDPTVPHIEPSPPYSSGPLALDTTNLISSGRSIEAFGPGASPDNMYSSYKESGRY